MSASPDMDSCNSCLLDYDNKERIPKILDCFHTYCHSCLEQFMFQDRVITCLSCGQTTSAESVSSLPDNPYLRPEDESFNNPRGRNISGNGEEVYYSDSDEDTTSHTSLPPAPSNEHRMENGSNGAHVQGVRDMVLNTQKANIHKVNTILESNLMKVQTSKVIRGQKEQTLREAIRAAEEFKNKLQEEFNNNQAQSKKLASCETKLMGLKNQVNNTDIMDYKGIKSINEEALQMKKTLKLEVDSARHHSLEQSIRHSTVKINFEKSDEFLSNLKAENDTIYMKLASSLENDPGMIFLTTFMLGNIFSEKIASHNSNYKDMVQRAFMDEGINSPQPLDDVSDYIDYIDQHFKSLKIVNKEPRKSPTPINPRGSGTSSPDEWKVVTSTRETKKETKKPLSFSDMAKKPGNPQPLIKRVPFPEKTIAQTNRPHCFFKVQVDNDTPFRVVFELRPDMAPKMVENFLKLCKGLPDGRGYKGSKIFRAKMNDHILGGDIENDDGTGGHSAYEEKYFLAEQCPLKDHKGAIRMKGLERTMDGRCRIGSQFMIWVGDLDYKEYRFTLVFGKVVEGFDQLREVSRIKAVQKSPTSWVLRQAVNIVDSGTL